MTATTPLRLSSSELRTVHGMGGIVRDALASIDDYRTAADGLRTLDSTTVEIPATRDVKAELADLITGEVLAGRPVPDDITHRARAMTQTAEDVFHVREAIDQARRLLTQQLDDAIRGNWGRLFAALHAELEDVIEQAKALGDVSGLRSAEDAIESDRTEEFRTWRALVERHANLRKQQVTLASKASLTGGSSSGEILYLSHPEKAFADWKPWSSHGYLVDPATGERKFLTPPWPAADPSGAITPAIAGSEEFLVWALRSDARLWVPTPSQFKAEATRLQKIATDDQAPRTLATEQRGADRAQFVDPSTVQTPKRRVTL